MIVTAKELSQITRDAYSFQFYGERTWTAICGWIVSDEAGWTLSEAVAVLNSKHMRWHRDGANDNPTLKTFKLYAARNLNAKERAELLR